MVWGCVGFCSVCSLICTFLVGWVVSFVCYSIWGFFGANGYVILVGVWGWVVIFSRSCEVSMLGWGVVIFLGCCVSVMSCWFS